MSGNGPRALREAIENCDLVVYQGAMLKRSKLKALLAATKV
jgi:hypothetical protein